MGASGGGEKGKEVSGDTWAGLRAGNELGTTITLPPLQAPQPRAEDKEEMTDWGGVGVGGKNRAFLWEELKVPKTSWAGQPGYLCSIPNKINKCFCVSTPHYAQSGARPCPWSCWCPRPLQGNSARMLGKLHTHPPSAAPSTHLHTRSQAISLTPLVFPILAASLLAHHFEPVSPLLRKNRRLTETVGGS